MTAKRNESEPEPAHVVIDKNTTARVNVGILVSIIALACGAIVYLRDIEHAVNAANQTLQEVKSQLASQNGVTLKHSEALILTGTRLDALERRVQALERKE